MKINWAGDRKKGLPSEELAPGRKPIPAYSAAYVASRSGPVKTLDPGEVAGLYQRRRLRPGPKWSSSGGKSAAQIADWRAKVRARESAAIERERARLEALPKYKPDS